MARIKNNGGGTNGEGGAPAEVYASVVQQPVESAAEAPTLSAEPEVDIPPGAQGGSSGPASMSTPDLLSTWHQARLSIDEHEREIARLGDSIRPVEQELCERYRKAAAEQDAEAIVEVGDYRMKVKARQARQGGGLQLVDARIRKAAVVPA